METGTIPPPVRFAAHWHPSYARPHAQIYQVERSFTLFAGSDRIRQAYFNMS